MASGVIDVCLIPEIAWDLEKLLAHVSNVIRRKGHCVICVAEGTGQVRAVLRLAAAGAGATAVVQYMPEAMHTLSSRQARLPSILALAPDHQARAASAGAAAVRRRQGI